MIRLAARLLIARLRANAASSLLVVFVLATAATAGASAVLLHGAVSEPWDRAFAATNGAHVQVTTFGDSDAAGLARLPGVVDISGPVVATIRELRLRNETFAVALTGLPGGLRVDRPLVVEGSAVPGAVVLERSFARALDAGVGDRVDVRTASGWVTLEVSGTAVSVRTPGYPATAPGSAFVDEPTAARLGPAGARITTVGLRLADPSLAPTVAAAAAARSAHAGPGPGPMVRTASEIRSVALDRTRQFQVVLGSFAVVLLAAAGFLVAVLLGARLRAQSRELLLLRLVGMTPGQLVGLVGAEHAVLAAAGAGVGTAIALAGGARLAAAAATALGSTAPRPGPALLVVAGGIVVFASLVGAAGARRTVRSSPSGLPTGSASRPSAAAARSISLGLPAPAVLAAKEVTASRARGLATVLAVGLAVMTSVAALGMEATFRHAERAAASRSMDQPGRQPAGQGVAVGPSVPDEERSGLRALVYGLQALLGGVAVAGIVAVGLVALRERRRELAVLSAIGFSARQLEMSTVAAQGALAAAGALVGIPLGIGFFRLAYTLANGSSAGLVDAPPLQLAVLVPVAVFVTALVAMVPASALRRRSVAAALSAA